MTRVDFYLLNSSSQQDKQRFACRLIQKVYGKGHWTYVQTSDEAQATALDELLWTFDQGSFIPHRLATGPGSESVQASSEITPVIVGCSPPQGADFTVLVSLADSVVDGYRSYERVAEIVDASDSERVRARIRYKTYRDDGCILETHHVAG